MLISRSLGVPQQIGRLQIALLLGLIVQRIGGDLMTMLLLSKV